MKFANISYQFSDGESEKVRFSNRKTQVLPEAADAKALDVNLVSF